jgi:hypothetical protein
MFPKMLSCAAVGLALLAGSPPASAQASAQDGGADDLTSVVRSADVIVVGRVLGTVDTKPQAEKNKEREAHWVKIERTLKSFDINGRTVRVRPNGIPWENGTAYVLFLKEYGNGFYDAIRRVVPNDQDTLNRILAISGGPRPKLQMRMLSGCGCCGEAKVVSFALMVDGKFEYTDARHAAAGQTTKTLVGTLSSTEAKALVAKLARTKVGPLTDCGGSALFEFVGPKGDVIYRQHSFTAPAQGAELLAMVSDVATSRGASPRAGNRR